MDVKKAIALAIVVGIVLPIAASAANLSSNQTQAQADIQGYMWNIASLIRTVGLVAGVVALSAGGIMFMMSSEDPAKRDQAKNIIKMGVGGAIIIALAPSLMMFLLA